MNWLLLETACPQAQVCIVKKDKVVGSVCLKQANQHSEQLSKAVSKVLKDAGLGFHELEYVGVGVGPGSFVGVRIGLAFAKGLCSALQIPLLGFSTLKALYFGSGVKSKKGYIFLDARRKEFYALEVQEEVLAREVEWRGEKVVPFDMALKLGLSGKSAGFYDASKQQIIELDPGVTGDGMRLAVEDRIRRVADGKITDEILSLVPCYVRSPDAVPPSFLSKK